MISFRLAVVVAVFAAFGGSANAAGVAQGDFAPYRNYVRQLSNEVAGLASGASGAGAMGPRFIDFNGAPDVAGLAAQDQALVRAMARTGDLFRALGGTSDRRGVVERADGRVYVGLDGEGGRWFADTGAATAFLLGELVDSAHDLPEAVRDAVIQAPATGCGNVACIAETAYRELVKLLAFVPRGTTVSLTLSAEGFSTANGSPVVEVPAGFAVHGVTVVDAGSIVARVSIGPDAPTGRAVLSAFNATQAFRSVENFAIQVVDVVEQLGTTQSVALLPGSGTIDALDDDHAGVAGGATTLDGTATGRIEESGDIDTFRIDADLAGTLVLSTTGSADVNLTLRNALGEVVAQDDDSAGWYNARLSAVVVPGTYFVSVAHCCGGTGSYAVSASLQ